MPIPAATPHVAGDPMVWGDFETNIAAYRAWVNDIPAADVADETFQREHLVRPEVVGFPREGFESPFQSVWWRQFGQGEMLLDWGKRSSRLVFYPTAVQRDAQWHTPIGGTLYLPTSSDVRVTCSGEANVTGNPASMSYNNGAGRLVLRTRQRSTGNVTDRTVSEFELRCPDAGEHLHQAWSCSFSARLGAGKWDVSLVYLRGSGSLNVYQIDLGRISMKLEAH